MKKIIGLAPLILALAACGTANNAVKGAPDVAFIAETEIFYGGGELFAQVTRITDGQWQLKITEPYALEGMTMTLSDGECRLSMFDYESAGDVGNDAVSAVRAIADAYDTAVKSGTTVVSANGEYSVSGTSGSGAYMLVFDAAGAPLTFTSDEGGLSVKIRSFQQTEMIPEFEAELIE